MELVKKFFKRATAIRDTILALFFIVVLVKVVMGWLGPFASDYIDIVKKGSPASSEYKDIVIGQAFESYFQNGEWKFEKKDGKKYVVFSGNFSYMEHPVEAAVYFVFANDEKHFSLSEIDLNNVPQDDATTGELLNNVYNSYRTERVHN